MCVFYGGEPSLPFSRRQSTHLVFVLVLRTGEKQASCLVFVLVLRTGEKQASWSQDYNDMSLYRCGHTIGLAPIRHLGMIL